MADEPKPVVTEPKSFTQEDLDRVVAQRLTREREKYADYDEVKKRAETLEAEEKKRKEAELSENGKLKILLDEKESQILELSKHKKWRDEWNTAQGEKINEAIKDFSEEDKDLVLSLPLEKRMAMVQKLSGAQNITGPNTGKMITSSDKVPTDKEYMEMRTKFGFMHPQVVRARTLINKKEQGDQ
jgi:hypothetical protein